MREFSQLIVIAVIALLTDCKTYFGFSNKQTFQATLILLAFTFNSLGFVIHRNQTQLNFGLATTEKPLNLQ